MVCPSYAEHTKAFTWYIKEDTKAFTRCIQGSTKAFSWYFNTWFIKPSAGTSKASPTIGSEERFFFQHNIIHVGRLNVLNCIAEDYGVMTQRQLDAIDSSKDVLATAISCVKRIWQSAKSCTRRRHSWGLHTYNIFNINFTVCMSIL